MDNIIFEKIWQEGNLLELKVTANSMYVTAFQFCYVSKEQLDILAKKIHSYILNSESGCYWETGPKEGEFLSAFSLQISPAKSNGHMLIEVDIEIGDDTERKHRCVFYVESELGLLERFGKSLCFLKESEYGEDIRLYEN